MWIKDLIFTFLMITCTNMVNRIKTESMILNFLLAAMGYNKIKKVSYCTNCR